MHVYSFQQDDDVFHRFCPESERANFAAVISTHRIPSAHQQVASIACMTKLQALPRALRTYVKQPARVHGTRICVIMTLKFILNSEKAHWYSKNGTSYAEVRTMRVRRKRSALTVFDPWPTKQQKFVRSKRKFALPVFVLKRFYCILKG